MRVRYSLHQTRRGVPYTIVRVLGDEARAPRERVQAALRRALEAPDMPIVVKRGHTLDGPPDLETEAASLAPDRLAHPLMSGQVDIDL
jgi:hypothetical protein